MDFSNFFIFFDITFYYQNYFFFKINTYDIIFNIWLNFSIHFNFFITESVSHFSVWYLQFVFIKFKRVFLLHGSIILSFFKASSPYTISIMMSQWRCYLLSLKLLFIINLFSVTIKLVQSFFFFLKYSTTWQQLFWLQLSWLLYITYISKTSFHHWCIQY